MHINSSYNACLFFQFSVQRNGPSLLSVNPLKLALQWTEPREGLGLRKRHYSLSSNDLTFMNKINTAFSESKYEQNR